VLARLHPLDLRASAFPAGHCARAPFNHMSSILIRTGPHVFEVLVFRSMARTAWHEAEAAMTALAARAALA
jgi:sarcosine oxidase subunit gamma